MSCAENLADIDILTLSVDLGVVMVEDGRVGTSGRGDGVTSVAGLDSVGGLAVLGGGSRETEGGADSKVGAVGVVFASVEGGELEGGDFVRS